MHLVFDIFQGIGIAAALGIRPFLPLLGVGGLAAADAEIHFSGTDYSFLQSAPFLLGAVIAAIALLLAERAAGPERSDARPVVIALALAGAVLGALEFAGSLARDHHAAWPGFIGGAICAAIGAAATGPLFARVRSRLDPEAAGALPVYAEGVALLLAILSVLAPPLGVLALLGLLWLIISGRRRADRKYAGLRILR